MTERFHIHVALLSAEYPPQPGGVGDYTRRLGEALLTRGFAVSVFTIVDWRFSIFDLSAQTANRQSPIANRQLPWGWRSWRAVVAALDVTKPDVLHIQYQTGAYGMHPAVNFLPWRLRALNTRPAIVVTAHDLLPPYLFPKAGRLREWVTRRLLADADAAVVTNAQDEATARGWGLAPHTIPIGSNIAVSPPAGYRRDEWRARLGVGSDDVLLAYFGLLSRTKGLDVLLDALEQLPERVRLLVIGGEAPVQADQEYAARLQQRIAGGSLGARVQITGHCGEEEVSAHLLAADIAALPFNDGASFRRGSLLAALAHGLPVITTTGPERAVLTSGEEALLVPADNPVALAGAIERLAADPALRVRLGAGGQAVAARFGWDAIAARHAELYRLLLR
jgi:glycosyltransferase involved in cell wall biosynthesis